jgi:hypothetical protein
VQGLGIDEGELDIDVDEDAFINRQVQWMGQCKDSKFWSRNEQESTGGPCLTKWLGSPSPSILLLGAHLNPFKQGVFGSKCIGSSCPQRSPT